MGCLDDLPAKVRAIMPGHFKSRLNATGTIEEILGHECGIHEIVKSAFLKEGAKARLWITKDFENIDPQGADSKRTGVRESNRVTSYDFVRFAFRSTQDAGQPKSTIGFRVVCEP